MAMLGPFPASLLVATISEVDAVLRSLTAEQEGETTNRKKESQPSSFKGNDADRGRKNGGGRNDVGAGRRGISAGSVYNAAYSTHCMSGGRCPPKEKRPWRDSPVDGSAIRSSRRKRRPWALAAKAFAPTTAFLSPARWSLACGSTEAGLGEASQPAAAPPPPLLPAKLQGSHGN